MNTNVPVGIFDSGVGGLTVAREIIRQLPDERFVYFGDTARLPYGTKSKSTIVKYSNQVIRFLKTQKVKAIVIACNSASAYALEEVEKEIDIPIIGVIKAGAIMSTQATKNGRIGIIGTEATVNTGVYSALIKAEHPEFEVFSKACPLLVSLVEEGWLQDSVTYEIASRYLKELKEKQIDTLILGCTHYPLIRKVIGQIMGPEVRLINPAYETAVELKQLLESQGLAYDPGKPSKEPKYEYYVSDAETKFSEFAATILPDAHTTKQISIEEY